MPGIPNGVVNNPNNKSLLELTFQITEDNGVLRTLPALHQYWTKRETFTIYKSLIKPNGQLLEDADLEEWLLIAKDFRNDMEYLLTRNHHVFWSYVLHEKNALIALKTYLKRTTPFYLELRNTKSNVLLLEQKLLNLVTRIINRLITDKESEDQWISKEALSQMLYKKHIITATMLFDLIIAVGDTDPINIETLRNILCTIQILNPQYKLDLQEGIKFFTINFSNIHKQTEFDGCAGAGGGLAMDNQNSETPYDDVILFTLDSAYTLATVLNLLPEMATFCAEINFGLSIAKFYNVTLLLLYKNIWTLNRNAMGLFWLSEARCQFIQAFRYIAITYLNKVQNDVINSLNAAENFLNLMSICLQESLFVIDYQRQYPLENDMDLIKEICKNLDISKYDYVLYGYQDEAQSDIDLDADGYADESADDQSEIDQNDTIENVVAPLQLLETNNVSTATTRDLDTEITVILDMLPELGTGFIRKLLIRYDACEDAIAALLEDNLPPDLVNADKTEPFIPPDPRDKLYEEIGIKHFNKYDGDKYDVLTNDKPNCIIKMGKGFPNAPKNANELLDDKRELAEIKHRYAEYALVTHDESDDDEKNNYEDEYDDSYEALIESESKIIKSKELKNNLANVQEISESETEESDTNDKVADTSESGGGERDRNRDFCENPEVLRARYEAKRQAKWGGDRNQQRAQRDVVGAPKGKGQDESVLKNRNKKEINKSTRANHNRKAAASFKRSKGMLG